MSDDNTSAPWSKDLETTFADPEIRASVDAFLRGNVQPHVTRLEQTSRDALELYNDLQDTDKAAQAYYSVTQELFGDELADRVLAALKAEEPEAEEEEVEEATPDDEVAEMLAERRAQKQAETYRKALDELKSEKQLGEEFMEDLFHPFVAGAGGDLDAAYAAYQEYYDKFKSVFTGTPSVTPAEVPAPPTLGTAPASGPTQKQYSSVSDAVNDMFAEMSAGPPPTVGAV